MFCLVFERQGGEIDGRRGVVDGRLGNKTDFEDQDKQIKTISLHGRYNFSSCIENERTGENRQVRMRGSKQDRHNTTTTRRRRPARRPNAGAGGCLGRGGIAYRTLAATIESCGKGSMTAETVG